MKTTLANFTNVDILKETKIEYFAAMNFIKETNRYFIGLLPVADYNMNPSAIRSAIAKRLLQITTWCKTRNIMVCAVIPEQDIQFYASMFNLADIQTWAMLRQDVPPSDLLTDHYFIAQGVGEQAPIYNACSCVFIVQPDEMEFDDELLSSIENENTVIFNVPKQGEIKFIDEGTPLDILQSYKRNLSITQQGDPYATFPDYNDNLVKRVPLSYFEDMMDARPVHDEPRRMTTSSVKK